MESVLRQSHGDAVDIKVLTPILLYITEGRQEV